MRVTVIDDPLAPESELLLVLLLLLDDLEVAFLPIRLSQFDRPIPDVLPVHFADRPHVVLRICCKANFFVIYYLASFFFFYLNSFFFFLNILS